MKFFDIVNDILYKKKLELKTPEDKREFQPFLIQRWLSMYSDLYVKLLNHTTNKLYKAMENDKDMWHKVLKSTIPYSKRKRFGYIKKTKKEKQKKSNLDDIISLIAKSKELSKREVELYINEYNLDVSKYKTVLKNKE